MNRSLKTTTNHFGETMNRFWKTTTNRSTILRPLAILTVLALTSVGLERGVAALSQAQAQVQVAAQPTATATVAAPLPAQVQVEGLITAVDRAAGTITVQDDDGSPATIVALGATGDTYSVGQEVEVYGTVTSAGSNGATVQAQFIRLEQPEAAEGVLAAPGTTIKVEGLITAVNAAAGTITVQDDDGGPATVVALGTAGGTYSVGQDVEVFGTVTSAGSNGATVQAQSISVDSPDGDGSDDGGDNDGD